MFDGSERRFEGLKAALSVAALAMGIFLSNMATRPAHPAEAALADVVGVWRWVPRSADETTPLFEIRRNDSGELTVRILAGSGHRVDGAEVSYEAGRICVVTEHGASFKGQLSEDGSRIHGVVRFGNTSAKALLERIERRNMRKAAARRLTAT